LIFLEVFVFPKFLNVFTNPSKKTDYHVCKYYWYKKIKQHYNSIFDCFSFLFCDRCFTGATCRLLYVSRIFSYSAYNSV